MTQIALERLSQIKTDNDFAEYSAMNAIVVRIADIQEAVALAKANQQPSIDAMRFEAAKAAMTGLLMNYIANGMYGNHTDFPMVQKAAVSQGDALIAELQKRKL